MIRLHPFHWRMARLALVCGSWWGATSFVLAQAVSDYAVRVSATVRTNPAQIMLSWPADTAATNYMLYRKFRDDTDWGQGLSLSANATSCVDSNVAAGSAYEYWVSKSGWNGTTNYSGQGYLYAGIQAPLVESRGKVVLIVDNTHASSLAMELARLQQDLVGDGWTVLRHDVARMAVDPANTSSNVWAARSNELAGVKALVTADYHADPANVKAVFLFGHVPVPYSGNLAPDGHSEHQGAWPADVYYGDMDGTWTDASVTSTGANDPRNRNVPGDGKFDQTELPPDAGLKVVSGKRPGVPSNAELQVGRVDLANLPAFAQSELELLRQYLNKDHNFRHKLITAERRGLIDDNFGTFYGEAFAVNGWRNFAPFFGATNTFTASDWFGTLTTRSYLWGYGCGSGTPTSAGGVGSTADFAANDPQVVFTMLFGSWFGDWDSQNNFLRAPLATPTYTLTCTWAGRPHWQFHHISLGETIGFSTRLIQNNTGLYDANFAAHYVHIALMGDPTLRLHPVAPPSALAVRTNTSGGVVLTWNASPDAVAGYHVYRAPTAAGPFTRLTGALTAGTNYTDPVVTTNVFMVRPVKLEVSGSGSYFNPSQGIFQDLAGSFGPPWLSIGRAGNSVSLSWPANALGYRLESTAALSPTNWLGVTNALQTTNGLNMVLVDPTSSNQFFRLRNP